MQTSRRLTFALAAIAALVAATPAFAQTSTPPAPRFSMKPLFSVTPTTPPTPASQAAQDNEQGLGIFLQGGFLKGNTYSSECPISCPDKISPTGFIFGVGFGGNKSGAFGIGADINYEIKSTDNVVLVNNTTFEAGTLKTHVLQVPIYGRVNFMGHATKSAPTLYILFGGFIDILLKGEIDGANIKDQFNGFDIGPMGGIGFEVARIGIEGRGMWAMKTLQSTGNNTFLNGMTESKVFTFVLLFKVRLN